MSSRNHALERRHRPVGATNDGGYYGRMLGPFDRDMARRDFRELHVRDGGNIDRRHHLMPENQGSPSN